MDDSVFDLAIIGSERVAEHIDAISKEPRFRLTSPNADEASTYCESLASHGSLSRAIIENEDDVDGIVVCTPPEEREYWALHCSRAKKAVLIDGPLVSFSNSGIKELRKIDNSRTRISMASNMLFSDFTKEIIAVRDKVGRCVYVDIHMRLSKERLAETRSGVSDLGATELLVLMERFIGPLDSVYVRSRSFLTNRPREDSLWGMLRFVNGTEAIIQVVALDSKEGISAVLHGNLDTVEISAQLSSQTEKIRRRQYRNLANVMSGHCKPECDIRDIQRCLFLGTWLEQSARQDSELYSSDIKME